MALKDDVETLGDVIAQVIQSGLGVVYAEDSAAISRVETAALRVAACEAELSELRALAEREVRVKDNTILDVRNRAHALRERAERAERALARWTELQALLVDDPAEAARRLALLTDQERWSREPEIDSRPGDDDHREPDSG